MPVIILLPIAFLLFFLFTGGKKEVDLNDLLVGGDADLHDDSGITYGTPTINKVKAQGLAASLTSEMSRFPWSSESKIMAFLNGLNEADYILVFEAFGLKNYDVFTNAEDDLFGSPKNLTEWLGYEITGTANKATLKQWFPNFF
ncbi:MAG: hypothetical protein RBT61_12405 [Candidatus Kapabacteria bacterium]|jgi:hypothetical protein|nr:hypothetical protein [Candidatus Kapabacteria bacterium]